MKGGSLYILQGSIVTSSIAITSSSNVDLTRLWYARLGDMSEKSMTIINKRSLLGGKGMCKLDFFYHCIFGKQKRVSYSIAKFRTKGILNYIHFDLWGPFRASFGGKHYTMTFVNDYFLNA